MTFLRRQLLGALRAGIAAALLLVAATTFIDPRAWWLIRNTAALASGAELPMHLQDAGIEATDLSPTRELRR